MRYTLNRPNGKKESIRPEGVPLKEVANREPGIPWPRDALRNMEMVERTIASGLTSFLAGARFSCASPSPANSRLPRTDVHYKIVKKYVEDIPDSDYNHASREAYEAFRDTKFGIRIHWGIYSIWEVPHASWPLLRMSKKRKQAYQELYKTWNPEGFDAQEWMDFFERSGVEVFAFTTKHHDGFSLFDTKTRVTRRMNWTAPGGPSIEECNLAYSIMETPFGRDVVKELTEAAHQRGIRIDLYFSHPDWYDADFRPFAHHPVSILDEYVHPRKWGWRLDPSDKLIPTLAPAPSQEETMRMIERHRTQLLELLKNYGKIDMICFDQWFGPDIWPELKKTVKMARAIQPDVMFRARGIGNYGDYYTPEGFVPGDPANTDMPWMVIYPLGASFSYDAEPGVYKGTKWIVHNLIDAASKGGSFMAAIGPDGNGRFHPVAVRQFEGAGDWLRVNGEAIYKTRMWDHWKEGRNVRFTRTKDNKHIYAICLKWPGKEFRSRLVKPIPGSKVYMLGVEKSLEWTMDGKELVISIPEDITRPCEHAWSFKVQSLR